MPALLDLDDTLVDQTGAFARWAGEFATEHALGPDTVAWLVAATRTLRPGALEGLAQLRADGWTLGIVTNGRPDNQLAKIERAGLAAAIDGWAVSGEAGVRKPDPRIFRIAAEWCGEPCRGGWVVGDSPGLDVEGGRRAGLGTVWISHGRAWPRDLAPPDRRAADTDLAIRRLSRPA